MVDDYPWRDSSNRYDGVPQVSVDVDAVRSAAYDDGKRDGMAEGWALGFRDGYSEGLGDLIERLRVHDLFSKDDYRPCLAVIEWIAGEMRGRG